MVDNVSGRSFRVVIVLSRDIRRYRYMVEEFVAAVRDPKTPRPTWLTETDSVANLNCIEKVYAKVSSVVLVTLSLAHKHDRPGLEVDQLLLMFIREQPCIVLSLRYCDY